MTDFYSNTSPVGLSGGPSFDMPSDKPRPRARLRSSPGMLGNVGGNVTVQGEVTGNWTVDKTLPRVRTKNSEKATQRAPMQIYSGNVDDLHVKQHNLVFAQKNPTRMTLPRRNANPITGTAYAMASMTGISTAHKDVYTQEDWEDLFWVPGRAKADWSFGDSSQDSSLAVQMRGSCSIPNHSLNVTFSPGDLAAWKSYNIDPDIRAVEMHKVAKTLGTPKNHLGVLLRKVTFEDIHRLPHTALASYLKKQSTSAERSAFLRTNYVQKLGDSRLESKERFFLDAVRAESTIGALLNISVLVEFGLLSINLKGTRADEDLLNAIKAVKFSELQTNNLTVDSTGKLNRNQDAEARAERWNKFVNLAKALGVYTDNSAKPMPHLDNVVDAAIRRTNVGLMEGPNSYSEQKAAQLSKMARQPDSLMVPGSMSTAQSAETRLDNLQRDYATMKYESYAQAEYHARKNILGVVSKGGENGTMIDIIM